MYVVNLKFTRYAYFNIILKKQALKNININFENKHLISSLKTIFTDLKTIILK